MIPKSLLASVMPDRISACDIYRRRSVPKYIEKLDALPHYQKGPITNLISKLLFDMAMCFGCLGVPKLMVVLFRSLRWIDESGLPSLAKGLLYAVVLTPALGLASVLRLRHLFPKEPKQV